MPQRPIDPDQEPITEFLDRLVNGAQVSRRTVLQRFAAAGLTAGSASAFLAACGGVEGTNENKKTVDTSNVSHPKTSVGTVTFSNWPLYIDEKVIPPWEKDTGGKMKYIEDYNDNEEFYAKVRQELEQGKPIGRELVAPTDWMAARWIDLGYAEPLDKANIPNAKNLQPSLQHPAISFLRHRPTRQQRRLNARDFEPLGHGEPEPLDRPMQNRKRHGRVQLLVRLAHRHGDDRSGDDDLVFPQQVTVERHHQRHVAPSRQ
jgi:hypothetical protein